MAGPIFGNWQGYLLSSNLGWLGILSTSGLTLSTATANKVTGSLLASLELTLAVIKKSAANSSFGVAKALRDGRNALSNRNACLASPAKSN
ncbi:hypothetical protein K2173_012849 (mitochondrion) [Erythroxylum novogranatense]|uniref:Uncharacterized protein n=1 Tax=Erythroxylum novogranatense TaxID=1862640 RepID=A0AAV8S4I9_9ROSI|nr:hypothetical protein K2173_012849 [Erythroxylum novogranatense]